MTFHELNILPKEELRRELYRCCGSTCWVDKMVAFFPMDDLVEMLEDAEEQWYTCTETDWKEAFTQHPAIGDTTAIETLDKSVPDNKAYQDRFGYNFILSATGKTATEMLAVLNQRLMNTPEEEIQVAAEEQIKITLICLQKLIT